MPAPAPARSPGPLPARPAIRPTDRPSVGLRHLLTHRVESRVRRVEETPAFPPSTAPARPPSAFRSAGLLRRGPCRRLPVRRGDPPPLGRTVRESGRGCAARASGSPPAARPRTPRRQSPPSAAIRPPANEDPPLSSGTVPSREPGIAARRILPGGTGSPRSRHPADITALGDEADRRGPEKCIVVPISMRSDDEVDGYERVVRRPDPPEDRVGQPVPAPGTDTTPTAGRKPRSSRRGRSTSSDRTRRGTSLPPRSAAIRFRTSARRPTRRTPATRSPPPAARRPGPPPRTAGAARRIHPLLRGTLRRQRPSRLPPPGRHEAGARHLRR